jgi:type II secretory pathway component PulK
MKRCTETKERGVALIMVIFMIVITSALLVSLTDSTYISMRLNRAAEQRLKAEYILKSAVNVAQVLIKSDTTQYDDPSQDLWMKFMEGAEIPGELVGVTEPNVRVSLLIASEKGKIPLLSVVSASGADNTWRNVLRALFQNLGFDNEQKTPAQSTDAAPTKMHSSTEMVANLIDYLDTDKDSYSSSDFQAQGIEGDLPPGEEFRNDRTMESLASELGSIPGFTPKARTSSPESRNFGIFRKIITKLLYISSSKFSVLVLFKFNLDTIYNNITYKKLIFFLLII